MNNHGCSRYFKVSSIPSLIRFPSLSTAELAAGVPIGVASRFATEILKPRQPCSFPSLSTCQVSIRASIYYVSCYIYLQIVLVLQLFCILIYVINLYLILCRMDLLNPLEHTAGCETGWAIDAFAVNSIFLSVDGMACLIPFESWRIDLSNGISHIQIDIRIVSIFML
jgi:hypothetical protein